MNNDRELLEQAAKAACIDLSSWDWRVNSFCTGYGDTEDFESWNPLTDDGDALRLAVKLNINVVIYGATAAQANKINIGVNEGECDGCIYKATRRCIVRAAAEIGKSL